MNESEVVVDWIYNQVHFILIQLYINTITYTQLIYTQIERNESIEEKGKRERKEKEKEKMELEAWNHFAQV